MILRLQRSLRVPRRTHFKQWFSLALLLILLVGCVRDSEFHLAPAGGGSGGGSGSSFMEWWQGGRTPTRPPAGATGLAKAEASPTPEPSATPSAIPQAVPDASLETIPGYQEVHNVSSRLECQQMFKKFQQQGLRLTLFDVFPLNQPGRLNAPRRRSRRNSSNYGSMFVCIFRGPDAVADRYALNDDYRRHEVPYPEQYPNDYRAQPQPFDDYNYSRDPHMGTPPPPDPNAPAPF